MDKNTCPTSATSNKRSRDDTPSPVLKRRGEYPKTDRKSSSKKKFQESWLKDERFNGWVGKVANNELKAECLLCKCTIFAGTSELETHAKREKHIAAVNSLKATSNIKTMFKNAEKPSPDLKLEQNVKSAEIRLSAFCAEKNIAYSIVNDLVPVIKSCFPDSKIANSVQMKRDKCCSIINNILAKTEVDELIEILKKEKFSILVDESPSGKKYMAIAVQFIHPGTGKLTVQCLELIELDAKDCTAENIYNKFKNSMLKKGIPLENISGLACDGANVMIGRENSFFSRLRADVPSVVLLKCICHSAALISSKASCKLPSYIEELINKICNYPAHSIKKKEEIEEMVSFFLHIKLGLLKPCCTRWLALQPCIERLLVLWEPLLNYFRLEYVDYGNKKAQEILEDMNKPETKGYLYFLDYALTYMNTFNALFQSKSILIHRLKMESISLFRSICGNFLTAEVLNTSLYLQINVSHPSNLKKLDDIYLGPKCENYLLDIENEPLKTEIKKHILHYYTTAGHEMQQRLPLDSMMFQEAQFISPDVCLNSNCSKNMKSVEKLCALYKNANFDANLAQIELQNMPFLVTEDSKTKLSKLPIDSLWKELSQLKDFRGNKLFGHVSKLAQIVMTLPHSNAECERIFSIVTDLKTKKRNRLGTELLNSTVVFRTSLRAKETKSQVYNITSKHIDLHNQNMYKHILKSKTSHTQASAAPDSNESSTTDED